MRDFEVRLYWPLEQNLTPNILARLVGADSSTEGSRVADLWVPRGSGQRQDDSALDRNVARWRSPKHVYWSHLKIPNKYNFQDFPLVYTLGYGQ
jgi:hypothetical protein